MAFYAGQRLAAVLFCATQPTERTVMSMAFDEYAMKGHWAQCREELYRFHRPTHVMLSPRERRVFFSECAHEAFE